MSAAYGEELNENLQCYLLVCEQLAPLQHYLTQLMTLLKQRQLSQEIVEKFGDKTLHSAYTHEWMYGDMSVSSAFLIPWLCCS